MKDADNRLIDGYGAAVRFVMGKLDVDSAAAEDWLDGEIDKAEIYDTDPKHPRMFRHLKVTRVEVGGSGIILHTRQL